MRKREGNLFCAIALALSAMFLVGEIDVYAAPKIEKAVETTERAVKEGQWINSGGYWWYRHTDGSCTKNDWEYIKGYYYHFDSAGWMQIGWLYTDGEWYYLDESGRKVSDGWQWIGSNCYYFNSNGVMARNTYIGDSYVDASGKWVVDQWVNSGGYWWYRHANGSCTKDDWEYIKGYYYHFDSAGWMQTGWLCENGEWYYLDGSGRCCESGWQWVGSDCYYFNSDGTMARNTYIGNNYVDASGKWVVDQWVNSGGYWWYRHANGSCTKGDWEYIEGYYYYFDSAGWMQTGWLCKNGEWYYLNSNGQMCTGWTWIGNSCFYFYSDGKMAADTYINGEYVNKSGYWVPKVDYSVYEDQLWNYYYYYGNQYDTYNIYDINDDGVDELIIRYCPCEADAEFWVYTIDGGGLAYMGSFNGFHSALMSSSEGGVYRERAHMGYREIDHIYYLNGGFVEQIIYEEEYGTYDETNSNPKPELLGDEEYLPVRYVTDYSLIP